MSDLTDQRDHARTRAATNHTADCPVRTFHPHRVWDPDTHRFVDVQPPTCPTDPCVTDEERRRWTLLADELDEYLDDASHADDDGGLFEVLC